MQFAATIHAARVNLNSLMGDAVDRAIAWNNSSSAGNESPGWVTISAIAGIGNPTKTPITAAVNFVNALDGIVSAAKGSYPGLDAVTCYGILSDYLHKADEILQAVSAKITDLVAELRQIRADMPEVPQWGS